jgi:hypothetical protein
MSRTSKGSIQQTGATSEKKSASATSQTMKGIRIHNYGAAAGSSSVNLATPTATLSCESVTKMERRKGNSHDSQAHIS